MQDGLVERPESWPGVLFFPEDFGRSFQVRKPEEAFFGGRRPKDWEPTYPPARRAHRTERRRLAQRQRERVNARDRERGRGPRRRHQLANERKRRKERAPRPRRPRNTLPAEVTVTIFRPPGYEHMSLEEVRAHFRQLLDARVERIHAERQEQGLTAFMGLERAMAQDPLASVGDTFPSFARNPRIACRDRGLRIALLQGLQEWRASYRKALTAWRDLDRTARFPWGAYLLPTFHGAETTAPSRAPPAAA